MARMFSFSPDDMVGSEAASREGWSLRDLHRSARGDWRNYRLVATTPHKLPKRCYTFGWNGVRVARCRDLMLLDQFHSDIYAWMVERLTALGLVT